MGNSVRFIDLSPTGTCVITGLQAGYDGQDVTITNLTTNQLTLNTLSGSSSGANQFRLVGNYLLNQYDSLTFKYSASLSVWVKQ